MKFDPLAKISSLQRHIDRLETQLKTPPTKYVLNIDEYKSWVRLEILRTLNTINKLKLGVQ